MVATKVFIVTNHTYLYTDDNVNENASSSSSEEEEEVNGENEEDMDNKGGTISEFIAISTFHYLCVCLYVSVCVICVFSYLTT